MIYSGNSFFDRAEVKDMMAYFKLVVNPRDDESFRRVVNKPARGIGDKALEAVEAVARQQGWPLFQAAREVPKVQQFCEKRGLGYADLSGLVFCLTGMSGEDFRLTYQMRMADDLMRYTSMRLDEVARRSGIGSPLNLNQSYQREYAMPPGERRRQLRKKGDVGRYRRRRIMLPRAAKWAFSRWTTSWRTSRC